MDSIVKDDVDKNVEENEEEIIAEADEQEIQDSHEQDIDCATNQAVVDDIVCGEEAADEANDEFVMVDTPAAVETVSEAVTQITLEEKADDETENSSHTNHIESINEIILNENEQQNDDAVTTEVILAAAEEDSNTFSSQSTPPSKHKEPTSASPAQTVVDNILAESTNSGEAADVGNTSAAKGITIGLIKSQLDKSEKVAATGKPTTMNPADEKCVACEKRVYVMDKLVVDTQCYHKSCFRCVKCNKVLSLGNFTINNGSAYCKPHFMELFKLRGRYDDQGHIDTRMTVAASNTQKH